jgi:hypothetical protein
MHGVTSSRQIERLCGTDVAFRVICGGNLPDHVTFARFRGDFPEAVGEFFAQVLILCARLGMGRLGTVALDGMKIAASASKSANRTEGKLAELAGQAVAAHAAADAAEDGLFGAGRRGDEVPEENLARVRAARAAALAGRRAAGEPRRGEAAGVDDCCRVREAQAKVDKARARAEAAERRAAEREAARKGPGPVRNITDPDSRLMPVRGGGFIQGYNAQNMTSGDELIIATELTDDPAGCMVRADDRPG